MRRLHRPRPLTLALSVLAPVLLVVGIWLGSQPEHLPGFVRGIFVDEQTQVVADAYDLIQDDYVHKVPKGKLSDAAIKGMVASLGDQFSNYFTPAEYKRYQEVTESRFSGVGLSVVGVDQGLRITRVYDKSPASRAGLKHGDLIVAVDGKPLKGVAEEAGVARVKGPAGSDVRLTVQRGKKTFERTVTRATVSIPVVESRMVREDGQKVGYLALASFSSGAHAEVYAAVRKLRSQGAKALVFDLRGNPGGLVREAQLVASGFIPEGTIVSTRGRAVQPQTLKATGNPVAGKLPMVVLVDRGHRVVGRDRDRRAEGHRPRRGRRDAHVRQGRLPGGRADAQRGRARHHGRPVLHAEGHEPRQGPEARPGRAPGDPGGGRPEDHAGRGAPGGPQGARP